MKYLLAIDLETTGLDPQYHELIEIGAQLLYPNGSQASPMFHITIAPEFPERGYMCKDNGEIFDVYRLNHFDLEGKHHTLFEGMKKFHEFITAHTENISSFKEITPFGQNVKFDISFLQASYKKLNWPYTFDYHSLELSSLYWLWHVIKKEEMPTKLSQNQMGKDFGLVNDLEHSAVGDIKLSVKLLETITNDLILDRARLESLECAFEQLEDE